MATDGYGGGIVAWQDYIEGGTYGLAAAKVPLSMNLGTPLYTQQLPLNVRVSPNPVRSLMTLRWSSMYQGSASVDVFDLGGRRTRSLLRGEIKAGENTLDWNLADENGARVPAGIYFVHGSSASESFTKRVVVSQ